MPDQLTFNDERFSSSSSPWCAFFSFSFPFSCSDGDDDDDDDGGDEFPWRRQRRSKCQCQRCSSMANVKNFMHSAVAAGQEVRCGHQGGEGCDAAWKM